MSDHEDLCPGCLLDRAKRAEAAVEQLHKELAAKSTALIETRTSLALLEDACDAADAGLGACCTALLPTEVVRDIAQGKGAGGLLHCRVACDNADCQALGEDEGAGS